MIKLETSKFPHRTMDEYFKSKHCLDWASALKPCCCSFFVKLTSFSVMHKVLTYFSVLTLHLLSLIRNICSYTWQRMSSVCQMPLYFVSLFVCFSFPDSFGYEHLKWILKNRNYLVIIDTGIIHQQLTKLWGTLNLQVNGQILYHPLENWTR